MNYQVAGVAADVVRWLGDDSRFCVDGLRVMLGVQACVVAVESAEYLLVDPVAAGAAALSVAAVVDPNRVACVAAPLSARRLCRALMLPGGVRAGRESEFADRVAQIEAVALGFELLPYPKAGFDYFFARPNVFDTLPQYRLVRWCETEAVRSSDTRLLHLAEATMTVLNTMGLFDIAVRWLESPHALVCAAEWVARSLFAEAPDIAPFTPYRLEDGEVKDVLLAFKCHVSPAKVDPVA